MQNNESALQKATKEALAILEKCQLEQKSYIAGVIAGMNAEHKLTAKQKPA